MKSRKNNSSGTKNIVIASIIAVLMISNAWLLFKVLENRETIQNSEKIIVASYSEKDALKTELNFLKKQFESAKTENSRLKGSLTAKDTEIKEKIASIEKLLNTGTANDLSKAKNELESLRKLNNQYIFKIAELKKENKDLNDQNIALAGDIKVGKEQVQSLEQQNKDLTEKIKLGAVFKIEGLSVQPIKLKSAGKESKVTKASKAQKLRVNFTLLENPLIEKGKKDVYMRIINPEGNTLPSGLNETIEYRGAQLQFSSKQQINYDKQDTEINFYWGNGKPFIKGNYAAEIYCEGKQIGFTRFSLK